MKKMKLYLLTGLLILGIGVLIKASNTDIWNLSGQGIYNAKDMVHVDSNYNFRLYNGNLVLGDNALTPSINNSLTTPSITVGGYYGLKVPFYNGSGASTALGSVIVASTTYNNATNYEGSMVTALATTTILGVSDGIYANGSIGYMTISGYALVQTTGTVVQGTLLVSTDTLKGYTGPATGTVVVGTVIGTAVTQNVGSLVLALIDKQ